MASSKTKMTTLSELQYKSYRLSLNIEIYYKIVK